MKEPDLKDLYQILKNGGLLVVHAKPPFDEADIRISITIPGKVTGGGFLSQIKAERDSHPEFIEKGNDYETFVKAIQTVITKLKRKRRWD